MPCAASDNVSPTAPEMSHGQLPALVTPAPSPPEVDGGCDKLEAAADDPLRRVHRRVHAVRVFCDVVTRIARRTLAVAAAGDDRVLRLGRLHRHGGRDAAQRPLLPDREAGALQPCAPLRPRGGLSTDAVLLGTAKRHEIEEGVRGTPRGPGQAQSYGLAPVVVLHSVLAVEHPDIGIPIAVQGLSHMEAHLSERIDVGEQQPSGGGDVLGGIQHFHAHGFLVQTPYPSGSLRM